MTTILKTLRLEKKIKAFTVAPMLKNMLKPLDNLSKKSSNLLLSAEQMNIYVVSEEAKTEREKSFSDDEGDLLDSDIDECSFNNEEKECIVRNLILLTSKLSKPMTFEQKVQRLEMQITN